MKTTMIVATESGNQEAVTVEMDGRQEAATAVEVGLPTVAVEVTAAAEVEAADRAAEKERGTRSEERNGSPLRRGIPVRECPSGTGCGHCRDGHT
jgi:hypothetical protein